MLDPAMLTEPSQLLQNPVFTGFVAAAFVGGIMVMLRQMPMALFQLFKGQFTVELTVYDNDEVYPFLNLFMARHASAKRARRVRVSSMYDAHDDKNMTSVTPGEGVLLMREAGKLMLFQREITEAGKDAMRRTETIRITALGRDAAPLRELVDRVKDVQSDSDSLMIREWDNFSYRLASRRPKRGMDTIYINEKLKAAIIEDVQRFLRSADWYAARAIPWRRGYLLAGPPGTGKSSLIFALACLLNKPVHLLNLAAMSDDAELSSALAMAKDGVVAIEDADAVRDSVSTKRGDDTESETVEKGVTLSGLLNAIDGIAAPEGRILFLTSNHPERLDRALIRPGRVDMQVTLDHAGPAEIEAMVARFCPELDEAARRALVEDMPCPAPQAEIQNRLLQKLR